MKEHSQSRAGHHRESSQVPVICIGVSAGGIEPLETIFRQLNRTTGLAFVVISHIPSTHQTWLPWLLSQWSQMPAELARDGLVLAPNHIYVIPPGREISLDDGHFGVHARSKIHGLSNVITLFLDSLARPRKLPGVAVILSGLDSDGSAALRSLHQVGGITIVQKPGSADYPDMPSSAIQTGVVDFVLSPEGIAGKIEEIAKSYVRRSNGTPARTDSLDGRPKAEPTDRN